MTRRWSAPLGPNATASVGVVSSSVWLFNGLLGAAATGFAVQVAQHIGARETERARSVVRESMLFSLLFGVFMGSAAAALSFSLPGLLGAEEAIRPDASAYFLIVGCSMPFLMAINLMSSLLRCMGDTRTPMLFNITLNILNTIFNFLLIYEPREASVFGLRVFLPGAGLGVPGAALGSALASLLVALLFLRRFLSRDFPLRISLRDRFRFTRDCLSAMIRIAIPQAMAHTASCGAQIAVTVIVAGLGTQAVAANSLAVTAEALLLSAGLRRFHRSHNARRAIDRRGAARSGGPLRAGQHAARYGHHDGNRPSDVPFRRAAHRDVYP